MWQGAGGGQVNVQFAVPSALQKQPYGVTRSSQTPSWHHVPGAQYCEPPNPPENQHPGAADDEASTTAASNPVPILLPASAPPQALSQE